MTREEAIKILNDYDINFERHTPEEVAEAHEMAVKALEEQPNERAETHECDCISRKLMHDMGATCIAARDENGDLVALGALDVLPSVNLQPKTGHWTHDGGYWKNRWICSECGYKLYDEQSKYCPNCGARMEG